MTPRRSSPGCWHCGWAFATVPLLVLHWVSLPEGADRVIRYAAAAVTALITLSARGNATGDATLPTLLALGAGVVMAVRQASMFRVLLAGLVGSCRRRW